jgi:hypothetical protein
MPGLANATERQLDAAAGAIIVQEHLPRFEAPCQPHGYGTVPGPDAGDQAVLRAVGNRNCLLLDLDRAKDLILRKAVIGPVSASKAGARWKPPVGASETMVPLTTAELQHALDAALLPCGDDRSEIEVRQGRPDLQHAIALGYTVDHFRIAAARSTRIRAPAEIRAGTPDLEAKAAPISIVAVLQDLLELGGIQPTDERRRSSAPTQDAPHDSFMEYLGQCRTAQHG